MSSFNLDSDYHVLMSRISRISDLLVVNLNAVQRNLSDDFNKTLAPETYYKAQAYRELFSVFKDGCDFAVWARQFKDIEEYALDLVRQIEEAKNHGS
ncbi:hypothetical protein [Bacillus paralicheniformis]|uniref:hypothetical protein n=1 Tax=Bacillus paralicheniformis TaxID=1648923 RepID=UPI0011A58C05|nr:hypothetical protein [Bacillus paralicheniformis]